MFTFFVNFFFFFLVFFFVFFFFFTSICNYDCDWLRKIKMSLFIVFHFLFLKSINCISYVSKRKNIIFIESFWFYFVSNRRIRVWFKIAFDRILKKNWKKEIVFFFFLIKESWWDIFLFIAGLCSIIDINISILGCLVFWIYDVKKFKNLNFRNF